MIKTEIITYNDTNSIFEGTISWDNNIKDKKPGILIAHAFKGQSQFDTDKAIELAKMGYVGFAIDMYGKGIRANYPEEAQKLMDNLNNDRELLLKRIILALNTLKNHQQVNPQKIGGIGFCFGGKCILDLARSGENLNGVVSFHGIYDKPNIKYKNKIQSSILVLHGWEDPLCPPDMMKVLAEELTERQADWQIQAYGNTGHSFTNPQANFKDKGMYFQETTNNRAWISMCNFFKEIFDN